MPDIVITKRVSLEFLGEDYTESYLVFKSIPYDDYKRVRGEIKKVQEDDDKALAYIKELLTERFVKGVVQQDGADVDVTADNFGSLPTEVLFHCMGELSGRISPNA